MIAKSVESTDFDAVFADFTDFDVVFVDFDVVFVDFDVAFVDFDADFGLKLVKMTIVFIPQWGSKGETSNFFLKIWKIHGFHHNPWILAKTTFLSELSRGQHEMKDHLPKKVTPIINVVGPGSILGPLITPHKFWTSLDYILHQ